MTDIEKEIRRLEKKMQKAKSEEEQLMIGGNLHHSQMGQYLSFRKEAVLFVKNHPEQVVGIDDTLHQDIGLALVHQVDGYTGCLIGLLHVDSLHKVGMTTKGWIGC